MRTMTASSSRLIPLALALAVLTVTIGAQTRDRSKTPEKFKWNLTEIYPTDAAWRTAKDTLSRDLPKLRQFQGKLTSSAGTNRMRNTPSSHTAPPANQVQFCEPLPHGHAPDSRQPSVPSAARTKR